MTLMSLRAPLVRSLATRIRARREAHWSTRTRLRLAQLCLAQVDDASRGYGTDAERLASVRQALDRFNAAHAGVVPTRWIPDQEQERVWTPST